MRLPDNFRTPRLLMTRFAAGDTADPAAMHRDPRVAVSLGRPADAEIAGSAQAWRVQPVAQARSAAPVVSAEQAAAA